MFVNTKKTGLMHTYACTFYHVATRTQYSMQYVQYTARGHLSDYCGYSLAEESFWFFTSRKKHEIEGRKKELGRKAEIGIVNEN